MALPDILPSSRFTTIVGSIALAGLLVWGAYVLTHGPAEQPATIAATQNSVPTPDWAKALAEIQAQSPLNQAPQPPSQDTVDSLTKAATNNNVTDTVARTLLVNISNAKSQGLGSDIPTQDALIQDAMNKVNEERGAPAYATADLKLSANTQESIKTYGNAFIAAIGGHTGASYDSAIYILATSTANQDIKKLASLSSIGSEYTALARDLARVAVPPTLAPLHLQIVNNFARIGTLFPDIQALYTDPLRALAALELYEGLNQETANLFINLAQNFSQNDILFNTDEPGHAWNSLAS